MKVTVTRVARVRRGRVPLEDASDATARVTSSGRGSRPRASAARAFRSPATTRASVATTEYPSATAAPRCSRSAWGSRGPPEGSGPRTPSSRDAAPADHWRGRREAARSAGAAGGSSGARDSIKTATRHAPSKTSVRVAGRALPRRLGRDEGDFVTGSAPGPSLATARAHLGTRVRPQPRASRRAFDLRVGAARGIRGVALVETSWLVASAG